MRWWYALVSNEWNGSECSPSCLEQDLMLHWWVCNTPCLCNKVPTPWDAPDITSCVRFLLHSSVSLTPISVTLSCVRSRPKQLIDKFYLNDSLCRVLRCMDPMQTIIVETEDAHRDSPTITYFDSSTGNSLLQKAPLPFIPSSQVPLPTGNYQNMEVGMTIGRNSWGGKNAETPSILCSMPPLEWYCSQTSNANYVHRGKLPLKPRNKNNSTQ